MVTYPDPAERFLSRPQLSFLPDFGIVVAIVSFVALALLPIQKHPQQFLAL
jgi:hypothetical protein